MNLAQKTLRLIEGEQTVQDFINQIESCYLSYFPKSRIKVSPFTPHVIHASLSGSKDMGNPVTMIHIKPFLTSSKEECDYQVEMNDIFNNIGFRVIFPDNQYAFLKDACPVNNLKLFIDGKFISKKSMKDPEFGVDYEKLPFRSVTGTKDKILQALDKNFKVMKDTLTKLLSDNMVKNPELVKSKL